MHLPHGGHIGRFSGLPEESTEAKEWSEKDVFRPKTDNRTQDWHRIVQAQDALNTANEVIIPVAENYDTNTLLDFILTAWVILVQRYQRDEFYHFTWGFEHDVAQHSQCISAADIEFQSQRVGADVKSTIRSLRSKDMPVPQSNFFFNNGTEEEWSYQISLDLCKDSLHATSHWQPPTMSRHQATSQLSFFASTLNALLHDDSVALSSFLATSEQELDKIWSWNTPMPPDIQMCHHEMVSRQAELQPDKTAIEAWDGELTYRQVEDYSNHLAHNLRLLDASKDQIIPCLFEKSRWTTIAVLAIMKAGACFALLDPAQPDGRLSAIVHQVKAKLILSSEAQSSLAARIAPTATIIPISGKKLERLYKPFAEQQPHTTLPSVSPAANMYVQFTSGSTGVPKGCLISHSQFTSGAIPRAHAVGYRSHSRVLDFASYAFDVCIDSMLSTLAHGGTLCTPSDERRMNDMSGAMRDMRVTFAGMTPSVARTLDPDIPAQLDSLALGGESISASDAASWGQMTRVVNAYGPSEATVGATVNADLSAKPYITLGKSRGCAIWLADPTNHNQLVPIGAVGELLIEGPIVGNGYLNNPEKTKEVFIEDPEFLVKGSKKFPGRRGRIYKTGDLVRYDPDGNGEAIFVGRQDQQVKLRGQRIELAEIEYNMQKNLPADIQLAAEVIKPSGGGEQTLVAFLVEQKRISTSPRGDQTFGQFSKKFQSALQTMTKQLHVDLPGYMVPSAYIPLQSMPLLVSCKTDRKRLREIGNSITRKDLRQFNSAMAEGRRPATELEIKLAQLWAKVLGGDADFSANDDFFSMGGDSLKAMRLVSTARENGIVLNVPDIMLSPTLSAMAAKAKPLSNEESREVEAFSLIGEDWDVEQAKVDSAALCAVDVTNIEDIYPCTPLQEGLMALSAKFQDAYVAQRVATLPVEVAKRLKVAFDTAVKSLPILRTRIVNVPGRGLYQVVLRNGELVRERGNDLAEFLRTDREESMGLGTTLCRYGLVMNPGHDQAHLIVTMHHAVYDGWSMPVMFERINRAFIGLETQRSASFKHFIKYLTQLDSSEAKEYWRERLDGTDQHQFPPLPRKGYTTQADSLLEHYVTVSTSTQSKLTLPTIIRGAWAVVSSLYMGQSNVVFGETLTGRSAPVHGIEQIEGPMITTVPIRVHLNPNLSILDYLQTMHAQTVEQIPHEHLGLQNIRRVSKDARVACDLRTGLVLNPKEDEAWGKVDLEISPSNTFLPADEAEAAREALKFNTYALMLVCTLDEKGFLVMASFDSNCISKVAMERVLIVLDRIVTAFLTNPEKKLGEVAVLDPQEDLDAQAIRPQDKIVDSAMDISPVDRLPHESASLAMLSPNDEKLQAMICRILEIPEAEIDPSDSFLELGGDSIGAMRLVSDARAQGFSLTVAQIFQSQSLSELAACMDNEKEDKIFGMIGRILGMQKHEVDGNDSFLELGGDSIGAMRLVSDARAEGLQITVAQIFQTQSILELASSAEELK